MVEYSISQKEKNKKVEQEKRLGGRTRLEDVREECECLNTVQGQGVDDHLECQDEHRFFCGLTHLHLVEVGNRVSFKILNLGR
jgi:hypothetical protein